MVEKDIVRSLYSLRSSLGKLILLVLVYFDKREGMYWYETLRLGNSLESLAINELNKAEIVVHIYWPRKRKETTENKIRTFGSIIGMPLNIRLESIIIPLNVIFNLPVRLLKGWLHIFLI